MKLDGRVAIVTGGGRGIGRGISLALAKAGANLAINYRKGEASAKQTASEIEALGRKALTFQCDVTDPAKVKEMVAKVAGTYGKIDILVNNAGIASRGNSLADTDPEEMHRVINSHVFGSFYFAKEVLPHMRKQKRGDIHFISSVSLHMAPAGHGPYAAAKGAMEAMARVLAKEELQHNVRVNIIACGIVETDMGRRLVKFNLGQETKELGSTFPFGRVCTPDDVGNLCVFLASEQGGYVSGHTIFLDGGNPLGVAKPGQD